MAHGEVAFSFAVEALACLQAVFMENRWGSHQLSSKGTRYQ
ncbi:hypothetical protein Goari_011273 [Gossypium aridum]|uniref:Uncharacterized protein n=1 Tax=Gossypium aridum TaxID=34290 RepID=A0A7J8WXA7_GOSAI|nr:hypothetical protein [Gossypium aridum]